MTMRGMTVSIWFTAFGVAVNVLAMILNIPQGKMWVPNLFAALVCAALLVYWVRKRREKMARERESGLPDVVHVIPSREATDPGMYAMMRAWETGRPVAIHRADDGSWVDSDTGEKINLADEDGAQ